MLSDMVASLIRTHEEEAARVARVLHDDVGQVLSAVGLQLGVLRIDFAPRTPEIAERTNEIQALLEKALVQIRDLSFELNPAISERAGLRFALDRLVGRLRGSFSGSLRLLFNSKTQLPPDISQVFYRIAECALDNAIRHSRAARIEVLVRPAKDSTTLEIRDDGAGFDPQAAAARGAGIGLPLMKHFAARAGLTLDIASRAGKGTIIKVSHPTPQPDQLAGDAGQDG